MRTFVRWYLRCLVALAFLTVVVVLFPSLVFLGVLLLVVPGLILAFVPTAFLYLLAIGPAVAIQSVTPKATWAVLVGAASVAAIALGLPAFAKLSLDRAASARQQADTGTLSAPLGPDVLIDTSGLSRSASCNDLCEKLLHLGPFDVVYVSARTETMAYRLKSPDCWLRVRRGTMVIGRAQSECFDIEAVATPTSASLTITPERETRRQKLGALPFWPAELSALISVRFDTPSATVQRTYVEGAFPRTPFYIEYGFSGGAPSGWRVPRESTPSWQDEAYGLIERAHAAGGP